jgi:hypothetical protein
MNKRIKQLLILLSTIMVLVLPYFVFAQGPLTELENLGRQTDFAQVDNAQEGLANTVATVISAFLSLLGIIFLIIMILAGYNWMTAGGNEEKVNLAKSRISRAIIGLIIIVSAYAITYFVFRYMPSGGGGGSGPVISTT